jgi:AraC family transcriptional regulator of adaptative response / methylphosphotriester-DNA alkyltransferase methyltransferase
MNRPAEITSAYIDLIDQHLKDLVANKVDRMLEIEDLSRLLFIHPTHLSDTIKATTGTSACGVYQLKIIESALRLLSDPSLSIKEIALLLTYEPSQFTKWFKRITNLTPKKYWLKLLSSGRESANTEIMTILKQYAAIPLYF